MEDKIFRTYNTPLVAWLLINGCSIRTIKLEGNSAVFYLTKPNNGLVDQWTDGSASGNITEFYRSYRTLLEQVMGLKEGRG